MAHPTRPTTLDDATPQFGGIYLRHVRKCRNAIAQFVPDEAHGDPSDSTGTEVRGLQNLPKAGGLVVYYHAPTLPIDMVYLSSYVYLRLGRLIGGVADRVCHQNRFIKPALEVREQLMDFLLIFNHFSPWSIRDVKCSVSSLLG